VTAWAGYEISAAGTITSCTPCGKGGFLSQVASTNLLPVYYAYIIGYYGHNQNPPIPDQNVAPNGKNLSNSMAALLLGPANAACPSGQICAQNLIVQAYALYAKQTYAAWPTKPLVWLLEGDYIQYTDSTQVNASGQSVPLTMSQLGQLAALITSAIKTNMPNAVVAIDHSNWISNTLAQSYWSSMSQANYDMVWTTGVANNGSFLTGGTPASDDSYSWLHGYTGKKIFVDQWSPDTWTNQSAATINALIANGVVALNTQSETGTAPVPAAATFQGNITALQSQLRSVCP
jgi:hypothetical protein